jgi:hypothetical protein
MKRQLAKKSLRLTAELVRPLETRHLATAAGGGTLLCTATCDVSCRTTSGHPTCGPGSNGCTQ